MFKKLLGITALGALLASSAFAEDILAKVSNGAISDNSAGVKVLSLDEMKEVKGGTYFYRDPNYDFHGAIPSYAYVATENGTESGSHLTAQKIGIDSGRIVLGKIRYVNNQKDYYLQSYEKSTGTLRDIWAWNGSYALQVLNDFKSRY
ncbi:hypothetical protein [Campylobacter upsaliensis]|uniref:hypothetical protein n=1 Tax=Campylobacter upsaliensis TaxID=28080 RepID=UPI00004B3E3B|nr:hypothetical protein [Campylobacter upsaliensis]EAL52496.1 hypothetical protein CUPA0040 [Campylobacter upsaliensis RM3195]MCR2120013.1 hypothetical protein [Campylobacter upsaliensis]MCR2123815.1 hypothetical protein [Campylobacter upsaliensis]